MNSKVSFAKRDPDQAQVLTGSNHAFNIMLLKVLSRTLPADILSECTSRKVPALLSPESVPVRPLNSHIVLDTRKSCFGRDLHRCIAILTIIRALSRITAVHRMTACEMRPGLGHTASLTESDVRCLPKICLRIGNLREVSPEHTVETLLLWGQ